MQFIRSVLFTILFYLTLVLVFIIAIPTLILPSKTTLIFGKILAYIIIFLLRFILGVRVTFSGIENLKKNERFFVASAHQSLLETFKRWCSEFRYDLSTYIWLCNGLYDHGR